MVGDQRGDHVLGHRLSDVISPSLARVRWAGGRARVARHGLHHAARGLACNRALTLPGWGGCARCHRAAWRQHRPAPRRYRGMTIEARAVFAGEIVAHFEQREHAAHVDRTKRPRPAAHRQAVFREPASPSRTCHPCRSVHGHELGKYRLHRDDRCAPIGAQHDRQAVSHLRHDVVGHVTVHGPVAGLVGDELQSRASSRPAGTVVSRIARRARNDPAIGLRHLERQPVQVDGMVIHRRQIPKRMRPLAALNQQRLGGRKGPRVERQHVEVAHLVGGRDALRAGAHLPLVRHQHEVAIDARSPAACADGR